MSEISEEGFGLAYAIAGIQRPERQDPREEVNYDVLRDEMYDAMLEEYERDRAACGEGREEG